MILQQEQEIVRRGEFRRAAEYAVRCVIVLPEPCQRPLRQVFLRSGCRLDRFPAQRGDQGLDRMQQAFAVVLPVILDNQQQLL